MPFSFLSFPQHDNFSGAAGQEACSISTGEHRTELGTTTLFLAL